MRAKKRFAESWGALPFSTSKQTSLPTEQKIESKFALETRNKKLKHEQERICPLSGGSIFDQLLILVKDDFGTILNFFVCA